MRSAFHLLSVFALLALCLAGRTQTLPKSVHVAPWDTHKEMIAAVFANDLPSVFLPQKLDITITSVHQDLMDEIVHFDPKLQLQAVGCFAQTADGHHHIIFGPSIIVSDQISDKDYKETLRHEYGHYVWYDLCTENERREYGKAWTFLKKKKRLPTVYGGFKVQEGAAEAFMLYIGQDKSETNEEHAFWSKVETRLLLEKNLLESLSLTSHRLL